jgi:hypothetical protein
MPITSFKSGTKSRSMLVGNDFYEPSSYYSIATTTLSTSTATVTFSSIPQTYTHLQLRIFGQSADIGGAFNVKTRFNSDTGNNYALHRLIGDGSSATTAGVASTGFARLGVLNSSDFTNVFSANVADILDYTNTNKYTTTRSLGGYTGGTGGAIGFVMYHSSLWLNTAAITSIELTTDTGNFSQYSSFALYGIKGV